MSDERREMSEDGNILADDAYETAALEGWARNPAVRVDERLDAALTVIEKLRRSTRLTFERLAEVNGDRCREWHGDFPLSDDGWTGADWSNAMCGEAGEAANIVKKLRRDELGIRGNVDATREELGQKLRKELGDVVIYADLLAQFYGFTLEQCVTYAFDVTSVREGMPQRLGEVTT